MEIETGMIVKSMAGHDSGRFYVVTKVEGKTAYIADGKVRKVEVPKKKNFVHLGRTNRTINLNDFKTNKSLRKLLHSYNT